LNRSRCGSRRRRRAWQYNFGGGRPRTLNSNKLREAKDKQQQTRANEIRSRSLRTCVTAPRGVERWICGYRARERETIAFGRCSEQERERENGQLPKYRLDRPPSTIIQQARSSSLSSRAEFTTKFLSSASDSQLRRSLFPFSLSVIYCRCRQNPAIVLAPALESAFLGGR
jgi:hypothetical protein